MSSSLVTVFEITITTKTNFHKNKKENQKARRGRILLTASYVSSSWNDHLAQKPWRNTDWNISSHDKKKTQLHQTKHTYGLFKQNKWINLEQNRKHKCQGTKQRLEKHINLWQKHNWIRETQTSDSNITYHQKKKKLELIKHLTRNASSRIDPSQANPRSAPKALSPSLVYAAQCTLNRRLWLRICHGELFCETNASSSPSSSDIYPFYIPKCWWNRNRQCANCQFRISRKENLRLGGDGDDDAEEKP